MCYFSDLTINSSCQLSDPVITLYFTAQRREREREGRGGGGGGTLVTGREVCEGTVARLRATGNVVVFWCCRRSG